MKENPLPYSDEKAYRIAYLVAGYIRKTLTEAEHDELDAWVEASDENMILFEELTDENNIEANLAWMEGIQTEKALEKAKAQLQFSSPGRSKKRNLWPFIAAASLIIAVVAIFLIKPKRISDTTEATPVVQNDAAPGGNKALLTLSDGTVINLEEKNTGIIQDKAGTRIEKKQEGLLSYQKKAVSGGLAFNTLSVPKGGQYALTLSDGTRVWINALSSIKFPEQFPDSERVVELSGEAYFDVAKDKQHPFVVRMAEGEEVKVLGTEFNIHSYVDEEKKEITLVEGSVEVKREVTNVKLSPGQQAQIDKGKMTLEKNADIEAATGWKNGNFVFRDANIRDIMQQAERWYDVQVHYKTSTSEHFNFTISRNEPLSKILRLMELTGKIHFKIENKNVYVLP